MVSMDVLERLFHVISHEPITFNKLSRAAKMNKGTVRTYLKLIEYVQSQPKIVIERKDFLVMIKKA